jgi:5-methyltetrahydrofolate--homocysteine methyltransferase
VRQLCDEFTANPAKPRFCAGVLGPTSRTVDLAGRERPGLPQRQLRRAGGRLHEAIRGLIDGGADILLVETIFDTLNAKAALFAVEKLFDDLGRACR